MKDDAMGSRRTAKVDGVLVDRNIYQKESAVVYARLFDETAAYRCWWSLRTAARNDKARSTSAFLDIMDSTHLQHGLGISRASGPARHRPGIPVTNKMGQGRNIL